MAQLGKFAYWSRDGDFPIKTRALNGTDARTLPRNWIHFLTAALIEFKAPSFSVAMLIACSLCKHVKWSSR